MKEVFSRHGIPRTLISDNGTQYSSREFKIFAREWGFDHVTSSPNYPQANGKSERAVQVVKSILKKAISSNGDFYLALLNYRNTPRDGLSSPAQLLMGRQLRCKLPVHPDLLTPRPINPLEYTTMLHNQMKTKERYDKHSKNLPTLSVGDEVVCVDGKARSRGTIVSKAGTPRSYIVENKLGSRFRRNRRLLIKCENETSPSAELEPVAACSSASEPPPADVPDEFEDASEQIVHTAINKTEPDAVENKVEINKKPTFPVTRRRAKILNQNAKGQNIEM